MKITITKLSSGYWHARGDGPCNFAQWPQGETLNDSHFFPEAGQAFRKALKAQLNGLP